MKKDETPAAVSAPETPADPAIRATVHKSLLGTPERAVSNRKRYWIGIQPGKMADGRVTDCPFENIDVKVCFRRGEPLLTPVKEKPWDMVLSDLHVRGTHVDLEEDEVKFIQKRVGEKVIRLFPLHDEEGNETKDKQGRPVCNGRILNVLLGWEYDDAKKCNRWDREIPNPGYIRNTDLDVPLGRFLYMCEVSTLGPAYRENFNPPPMVE